mgnify:CR=1 FL=1
MRPEPAWIDENDHLNMAYYHVFFARTHEEAFDLLGLDKDYCANGPGTVFVAICSDGFVLCTFMSS